MLSRRVARDGEAKPGARYVLVPGGIEPVERLEGIGALVFGDAGTVIIDNKLDKVRPLHDLHFHLVCKALGIRDDVGDSPPDQPLTAGERDRVTLADSGTSTQRGDGFADKGVKAKLRRRLAGLSAGESEIFVQHGRHLLDVLPGLFEFRRVIHHGELELQPGERRSQVVADAGEHRGALLGEGGQARAHIYDRAGRIADFCRA